MQLKTSSIEYKMNMATRKQDMPEALHIKDHEFTRDFPMCVNMYNLGIKGDKI